MSDFDKEAERERLREKYEQEEEKREVTEKMSELLLQGATMTNAHCSDCGDPIFRYDGQEFCATCERPVDRAGDEAGEDDDGTADGDAGTGDGENIEVASPSDDARVRFGDEDAETGERRASESAEAPRAGGDRAGSAHDHHPRHTVREPAQADADESDATSERHHPAGAGGEAAAPRQGGAPRPRGAVDLDQARGALGRTLTRLSRQAEATDDPREAEAYLSAAREAAETLAALRR